MPKRIVVCCDGTWNTRDQVAPTNVDRICDAILPADESGMPQLKFYHRGIGTNGWDRILGGATGLGLSKCIRDTYEFIVQNFTPGDELFLLGFSRGAYTARSLAGFIKNCGVLRPEYADRVGEAYRLYRDR